MAHDWYTGNANDDAPQHRGWLLGHFIQPPTDVRATTDLEVKWGIHPAGEQRHEWVSDDARTTLVILISGRFQVQLSTGTANLVTQGDYVMWGPGIDHIWQAEEDSVVLTVRWPSI